MDWSCNPVTAGIWFDANLRETQFKTYAGLIQEIYVGIVYTYVADSTYMDCAPPNGDVMPNPIYSVSNISVPLFLKLKLQNPHCCRD